MSTFHLEIDGQQVPAQQGETVLVAAQRADIDIPTLCHHPKLEPFGGCRLCIVEIESRGSTALVASCVHAASDGLVVRSRSPKIDRIRKTLVELLMAHAPVSPALMELAEEYGADPDRYEKEASFCVHCGLCVRYCAEVKGSHVVAFVDRGIHKEIAFLPDLVHSECGPCKECFPLCPTSYLQAVYVLTGAMAPA